MLSCVSRPMRPRATPSPARTAPSAFAAVSSLRTTVVPMPTIRPPLDFARLIARCGPLRNAKRLVERETRVQRRGSGRGDPRGVGERGEADTALPPGHQRSPFQRKSSRGRLECDRVGCNAGPNVPQGQRFGNMRVLDRPPAAGKSGENGRSIAEEI